jgi:hypothetical protein
MPLDYVVLEFTMLPLNLGYVNLPILHILDRAANPEAM